MEKVGPGDIHVHVHGLQPEWAIPENGSGID